MEQTTAQPQSAWSNETREQLRKDLFLIGLAEAVRLRLLGKIDYFSWQKTEYPAKPATHNRKKLEALGHKLSEGKSSFTSSEIALLLESVRFCAQEFRNIRTSLNPPPKVDKRTRLFTYLEKVDQGESKFKSLESRILENCKP